MKNNKSCKMVKALRAVILLVGVLMVLFCIFIVPLVKNECTYVYPEYASYAFPAMIYLYITAIPFFIALFSVVKICGYVANDQPFSEQNVRLLHIIEGCAGSEMVFYTALLVALSAVNLLHPSLFILFTVIDLTAVVLLLFSAVLAALVQRARELQEETKLTI